MNSNPKLEKNVFFDINKLPPEKGLVIYGLSMNRLDHGGQAPEDCLEWCRTFVPSKVSKPLIGCILLYSDFLYLYSDKSAPELKNTFMNQLIHHKNGFEKLLEKNNIEFQIQQAFNYLAWNQMYLGTKNFDQLFGEIKSLYKSDELLQKYIKEDSEIFGREMGENQVNFLLEEALMTYLLSHNEIKVPNEYIQGNQRWILFCYSGRPPKSIAYLYQLNPFKLNWSENPYQNSWYDLESKQLIEFDRVDLETYSVK